MLRAEEARLRPLLDAVRAEAGLPVELPPEALAEAQAAAHAGPAPVPGRRAGRRDLTDVPFVTIDPPGSTDLDQAVHLARRHSGYRVHYAIADTAAFVLPGGAIDAAAHERVQTVYCPDVRVPLHPPVLSEGAASLLAGQDRPALVWTFDLDADGVVQTVDVQPATVRSRAQLDYASVQARLDAGAPDDDVATLLAEVGLRRAALERARGGVSLGRAEQEVVPAPDGGLALAYRASLPVEDHNAQISLMTGMAAADLMLGAGIGVLRTMPPAQEPDLERLRTRALALGVPWEQGRPYGEVLASLDGGPGTAAFLGAATALFRGAAWTPFVGEPPEQRLHGAIAAPYAHVTAPLRRLVDRYGLEVCLAADAGAEVPDWVLAALPTLGEEMAAGVRRGSAVDRAATDLVEAAVLEPHVGRLFHGVALDERTVQVQSPAVVARTTEPHLPPGEAVTVRLVQADVTTRTVRFEVVR